MKKILLSAFIGMTAFTACDNDNGAAFEIPDLGNDGSKLPYTVIEKYENGVEVRNGGFGSAATAHPTLKGHFYALTDRGANAKIKGGKIFPTPDYTPRIGHFKLMSNGNIKMVQEILIKNPSGEVISGRPNPEGKGATGETPYDVDKNVLEFDEYGLDTEGLVALKDGTFWVSDEYGPHMVHLDAFGRQIERVSPKNVDTGNRKLPAVFERRRANRGMEGLAITPDEKTLVGIMQSTMYNPSKAGATNRTVTRIVTFNVETAETKQFLYRQEKDNNSNSEIVALSDTEFLVIERDGKFTGSDASAQKHVYKIDISNATDVSGTDFDSMDGLLINGKTIEASTWAEIESAEIQPVAKTLAVDVVSALGDYPHDKLEGLWVIDGEHLGVLNDDDFAVSTGENSTVIQKILPGTTDTVDGNVLYIVKY